MANTIAESNIQVLRSLLDSRKTVMAPGAHDPLSAKLIEQSGFKVIWLSGFGVAYSQYFAPDTNYVTMTEHARAAKLVARAVNIPIIADIDNGYGNAINVMRAVEEFQAAGVSAITLEDQVFPKRCGIYPGYKRRALISEEEMIGKIRAARKAQKGELVLIARTDAMDSGESVERALERAYSYAKAGADVVLPISRVEDELLNFAKGWDGSIPIITGPTVFPNRRADFWGDAGYSIVIYSVHVLQTAIFAMEEFLQGLQEKRGFEFATSKLTPFDVLVNYIGLAELIDLEKEFLPS